MANSSSPGANVLDIAGLSVGLTVRGRYPKDAGGVADTTRFSIRRLVSPPHERIDMPSGSREYLEALKHTQDMWKESPRKDKGEQPPSAPAGIACRRVRSASRGVLLLYPLEGVTDAEPLVGFAVSFPDSDRAKPQEYQVTKDAWAKIHRIGEEDPLDDDEDDEVGVAL